MELPLRADDGYRRVRLRFIPFATEQTRATAGTRPYIFQDDMIGFVWDCFWPEPRRVAWDARYNFELWGLRFAPMVRSFKDTARTTASRLEDLYAAYGAT